MKKSLFALAILLCSFLNGFSQVTGSKTIGVDYPTLLAAITDLNNTGVGAGGATINVPAGYTETAPAGGFLLGTTLLNGTLSAANPLIIQKSGAGANPVLTAYTGGTSTTTDGIFKIAGADYVTINGINVQENAANTAAAFMEWGYALVNLNAAAPFDGCQNITIRNCSVTLNRTSPNGAWGIYSVHNTATSNTALIINSINDAHSNNKFYSNNVSNVTFGIYLNGFTTDVAPFTYFDQNNDIGGTSAATGNTITNFGGNAAFNTFGIAAPGQNNCNISYNTVDNALGGVNNTTTLYGIYAWGPSSTFTINNNNVTVKEASTLTTNGLVGIYSNSLGTNITATNNTSNVFEISGSAVTCYGIFFTNSNNITVTGSNVTMTQSLNGITYGINSGATGIVNISNNTLSATTTAAVTGVLGLIYHTTNAAGGATFNNNSFNNVNYTTTGTTYMIFSNNATPNVTVTNNQVTGTFVRGGASGTMYGYYDFGSPTSGTANISNNNFSNITVSGSTALNVIYQATATAQTEFVNNNIVSNITGGTGTIIGIYHSYGAVGSTANNNTVTNITSGGTISGMSIGTSLAGLGGTFSGNIINTLSSTGASTVTGILHTAGTNSTITKNKICNLQGNNAAGFAYGISVAAATTSINIHNNMIGDLRAPITSSATDGVRGISMTGTTANSNFNVRFNTINLNATSSGANFAASGVFHTTSATATSAALDMRNNIIVNTSTANGTGIVAAYRRSSTTLTNYAATSDRNDFFGTNIYTDGTNTFNTLAAYQAFVTPRDANSQNVAPNFLSTACGNANFLHIDPNIATTLQGGALPVAGIIDDFDGDIRNPSTPDIGADEFTRCTGAIGGTAATTTSTLCGPGTPVITATGFSAGTGSGYQWMSSANSANYPASGTPVAGQTNPATLTTGVVSTTTYYWLRVTCTTGTATAYSNMITITVYPTPAAAVTPSTATICAGQSVTLTETGGTGTSWSWAPGGATTQSISVSPASNTTYTVTVTSVGGCVATANATVTVNPLPAGVTASASNNNICAGTAVDLFSTPGVVPASVLTQNFESGPGSWTVVNTSTGGTSPALVAWTQRSTGYTYSTDVFTGNQGTNFYMANADAGGSGIVASTTLTSPAFSTMGYATLNMNFIHYYRHVTAAAAFVEVSTDGTTWTTVQSYGATTGTAAAFVPASINLNAYIGNPSVSVRFRFAGGFYWYWAVDNIAITGTSAVNAHNWTSSPAGFTSALQNPTGVSPTVTTTYTVTVTGVGGCTSTASTIVNVNTPVVTETIVQPTTCVSTDGSINIVPSGGTGGVGPYSYTWTGPGVVVGNQNQSGLAVGNYSVTVTDMPSGCSVIKNYILTGPGGCSLCPTIPSVTAPAATCQNTTVTLTASGLTDMGVTYGISFISSTTALADPYAGGLVIATVPNGSLTSGGTVASTTTSFPVSGNYFIYAILSPLPTDPSCRPSAVTNIVVNPTPAATISYSGTPYCQNAGTANVTQTGTNGGTYSSTTGLTINPGTGAVTLGTSTPGTYTVTYTIAASGGCAVVTATTSVTVTATPAATISYTGSPYCQNAGTASVTRTGTAGGTYSSTPAGLILNTTTGAVTLGTSTPGTYTVTYTVAAGGGCAAFSTTANITITTPPAATISYTGSPYCQSAGTASVTRTGTAGGTYSSSPAGLTINNTTGAVTLGTSTAGTYTVTYTVAASGGCAVFTTTASITVTATPSATISYAGSPYCSTTGSATVTRTGTAGGTYTASPAGIVIDPATGAVNLATSTSGSYTVTYTVAASGGCAVFITTAPIILNSNSTAPTGATASVTSLCGSGTVNLSVVGGTLASGATWRWYTGICGGVPVGTGATLNNISVNTTTTFFVRAEGICNNTTCASVTVVVNTLPSVVLVAASYPNITPYIRTGLFTTVSPAGNYTYQWFKNGTLQPTITTADFPVTVDDFGSYRVIATNTATGCSATSNTVAVGDSASTRLFVYPNPSTGKFQVRYYYKSNTPGTFTLNVYDSKGSRVYSKAYTNTEIYQKMEVNITNRAPGMYIVEIRDASGKQLATERILKN